MNIRITAYRHSKLGIRSSKDFKSSVRNGNVIVWLSFFFGLAFIQRIHLEVQPCRSVRNNSSHGFAE